MPIDSRFFESLTSLTVGEVAGLTSANFRGDPETPIGGLAAYAEAKSGDLCFHTASKAAQVTEDTFAAACFVKPAAAEALNDKTAALITQSPRLDFIKATNALYRLREWDDEGPAPIIHETAKIASGAVIGTAATIGEGSHIGPNAVIGPGVQIGRNTIVGPNASIRCALIGDHVNILSGARIGECGFGVTHDEVGAVDVPQLGRVIIQDHVLVGANTCIDRGALSDTIIGERTKIDNLVQIGHGVILGRSVLVASLTGISGSVKMGDNVVMGGQVGIADHVEIGSNVQLAAAAGVLRNIPDGERWGGTPAKPLRQFLREIAWVQREAASRKTSK